MGDNGNEGVGVVVEPTQTLSAGEEISIGVVLREVQAGAELHRVGAARRGYEWFLVPGPRLVPREVGEAAAESPFLVTQEGPVGVVCWVYRSRKEPPAEHRE